MVHVRIYENGLPHKIRVYLKKIHKIFSSQHQAGLIQDCLLQTVGMVILFKHFTYLLYSFMLHLPSKNMAQCLIFSLTQLKQRAVPANQHKRHLPLATPVCLVYQTCWHIFHTLILHSLLMMPFILKNGVHEIVAY